MIARMPIAKSCLNATEDEVQALHCRSEPYPVGDARQSDAQDHAEGHALLTLIADMRHELRHAILLDTCTSLLPQLCPQRTCLTILMCTFVHRTPASQGWLQGTPSP